MTVTVPRRSATTIRHPRAPLAAGWALRRIRELAELAHAPGAIGRLPPDTLPLPVRSMWTGVDLPRVRRDYALAFHGAEHIRKACGRELEVMNVLERGLTRWQDNVVCRKAQP